MTTQRITKRTVDALQPNGGEFTIWDDTVTGFGVRVRPTGAKSYVVVYRAGAGHLKADIGGQKWNVRPGYKRTLALHPRKVC